MNLTVNREDTRGKILNDKLIALRKEWKLGYITADEYFNKLEAIGGETANLKILYAKATKARNKRKTNAKPRTNYFV